MELKEYHNDITQNCLSEIYTCRIPLTNYIIILTRICIMNLQKLAPLIL